MRHPGASVVPDHGVPLGGARLQRAVPSPRRPTGGGPARTSARVLRRPAGGAVDVGAAAPTDCRLVGLDVRRDAVPAPSPASCRAWMPDLSLQRQLRQEQEDEEADRHDARGDEEHQVDGVREADLERRDEQPGSCWIDEVSARSPSVPACRAAAPAAAASGSAAAGVARSGVADLGGQPGEQDRQEGRDADRAAHLAEEGDRRGGHARSRAGETAFCTARITGWKLKPRPRPIRTMNGTRVQTEVSALDDERHRDQRDDHERDADQREDLVLAGPARSRCRSRWRRS